ncbi:RidA family protein [Gordonia sp. VNQ95]|uniref:RidA family protein n=1 Tax=Gordonia sp. VNQ95 TaxID=3156619 RepID=UPI0032B35E24
MGTWTRRLDELGIALPTAPKPVANYVPAVRSGNLVYTSGQLPFVDGELSARGKVCVGAEGIVKPDQATAAARQCTINALAAVDGLVGIDAVVRVVKVTGFVASAPGFTGQPGVLNGASDLLGEIFGDAGVHARSAVGVTELPLGSPVEVELIVEVADQ